jgi:hypothetical protein
MGNGMWGSDGTRTAGSTLHWGGLPLPCCLLKYEKGQTLLLGSTDGCLSGKAPKTRRPRTPRPARAVAGSATATPSAAAPWTAGGLRCSERDSAFRGAVLEG